MKVVFVTHVLSQYRLEFHEQVRQKLAARNVEYHVLFGEPTEQQKRKGDCISLPWGKAVKTKHFLRGKLIWFSVWRELMSANLVVVGHENRFVVNYFLQLGRGRIRPLVAFFGHGRNFQARDANSLAERWKRFWSTRVDWWFAYTENCKSHLLRLGYPTERITVLNNAIDTKMLLKFNSEITSDRLMKVRSELGLSGQNTCVLVAAFYPDKRLKFLIEALDLIRSKVPNFEFVAVGGGVDSKIMEDAAKSRPWLKVTGPKFGREKAEVMLLGKLFLIPGAVGLAVLDAGVLGLPVITTNYPYHGPEITYVEDGKSGRIVEPWTDARAYASAVVDLLNGDSRRLEAMSIASRAIAEKYTIEAMSDRFSDGVLKALTKNTPEHRQKDKSKEVHRANL